MKFRLQGSALLAAITTPGRRVQQLRQWFAGRVHRLPIAIAMGAALVYAIATLVPQQLAAGPSALPTVPMTNLDGSATTTDAWRGGGPMVLNIWATWCPPCRIEMPSLTRLRDKLASDQIRVVALSVDDDQHLVREFMLKHGIDLPVGISTSPADAMTTLGATGIPLTLYVDAEGHIVDRYIGERDWSHEDVVNEVRTKLLRR